MKRIFFIFTAALLFLSACEKGDSSVVFESDTSATSATSATEATSATTAATSAVTTASTEAIEYIPYAEAEIPVVTVDGELFTRENKAAVIFLKKIYKDYVIRLQSSSVSRTNDDEFCHALDLDIAVYDVTETSLLSHDKAYAVSSGSSQAGSTISGDMLDKYITVYEMVQDGKSYPLVMFLYEHLGVVYEGYEPYEVSFYTIDDSGKIILFHDNIVELDTSAISLKASDSFVFDEGTNRLTDSGLGITYIFDFESLGISAEE
jgi:hypothetical protein